MLKNNLIIAEIGSVHDGSLGNALKLIEIAKQSGADAAKFQMHIPEFETTKNAPSPEFFKDENRYDYFKRTSFTLHQWQQVAKRCKELDIQFICSPFSIQALNLLIDLDIDAIKIASGELTNLELIQKSIESSKPLFISTGMSDYNEISSVMQLINLANYNDKVVLMQCTSVYPCPPEMAGLNVVSEFTRKYKVKIGFSDHTNSNSAAVIASYLGANYIEKHITFSNLMYGSDAKFAYTPDRFLNYVKEINDSRLMRQFPVNKDNITPFLHSREVFQKSLTLNKNLKKGSILTSDDLVLKKPGNGLPHSDLKNIVGRKTLKDLFIDDQITFQDVK